MSIKESVAKTQLQLLRIQLLIQAEGWDKDPDWVKREKGRFSNKNGSTANESDKKSESLLMEELQASYDLLTKEAKEMYESTINSESANKVHNDISTAIAEFSDTASTMYKQAIEQCKKVKPKEYANTVNKEMTRHPLESMIAATILGSLTGLCMAGVAMFASEALIAAALLMLKTATGVETKAAAFAAGKKIRSNVNNMIPFGIGGIVLNRASLESNNKAVEGRKRRENVNNIIDKLKLKLVLKQEQADKFAESIYDTYADVSEKVNGGLKSLDEALKK